MITIASESNYAHSLTFDSIEAVEAEAADCSRYASRADYPSDIAYIANLLDLPESHVRVEEVITLTRSQLRKLEADMSRLVSEVFIDSRWTPPPAPLAVGDVIKTVEDLERLPVGAGVVDYREEIALKRCEQRWNYANLSSESCGSESVMGLAPITVVYLPKTEATE